MRLNGIDAVLLNREEVKEIIPMADFSENVRFPIFGGLMQPVQEQLDTMLLLGVMHVKQMTWA